MGTLTVGKFAISKVVPIQKGFDEREVIRLAAALEQRSDHPIATGIVQKAQELAIALPFAENFTSITGQGVSAMVEGKQILVVSPGYLKENKLAAAEGFMAEEVETVVFLIVEGTLVAYLALSDQIARNQQRLLLY